MKHLSTATKGSFSLIFTEGMLLPLKRELINDVLWIGASV
jgi:hypothetical protein